jgi:hypothetical protein
MAGRSAGVPATKFRFREGISRVGAHFRLIAAGASATLHRMQKVRRLPAPAMRAPNEGGRRDPRTPAGWSSLEFTTAFANKVRSQ